MSRINVRTINGAKHNGHLDSHHQRVQNRAAAVLDAWDEYGETLNIDVIAHIHRIKVERIEKDLYGDPAEIKERFGTGFSIKLQNVLKKCIKEIDEGVNPALTAVAHNIPYKLIRDIQNNPDMKQIVTEFLCNINKLNENEEENNSSVEADTSSIDIYSTENFLTRTPLASIENRTNTIQSNLRNVDKTVVSRSSEKSDLHRKKTNNSSTSSIIRSTSIDGQSNAGDEASHCSASELDENEEPPSKRMKKPYHHTHSATLSELQLNWSLVGVRGVGLTNTDTSKKCRNICYINAIVQCLANTAPFVEWLLNSSSHGVCELTASNDFCSVCILRSIINDIHRNLQDQCASFSSLAQASAVLLARNISKLSSNFIPGRQEDSHEFLIVLLNHLMCCLSSVSSSSYTKYLYSPLHFIFGINIQSCIKCTRCSNITTQDNYESIWSIPIVSYSNLDEALRAFCSIQNFDDEDLFDCSKCRKKMAASQSFELINSSPVIFIHLKRFVYDNKTNTTKKLNTFISYPELLDLYPFFNKNASQINQENHSFNKFYYKLYAVVVHLGDSADNGHIFSYVCAPDNNWYKTDDESVTSINFDHVLTDCNSYILCYTKVTEETLLLSESEVNKTRSQSPCLIYSSTPVRLTGKPIENFDDCTPIRRNFTSNIYDVDDELIEQMSGTNSPISNEYLPGVHEKFSVHDSINKDNLLSFKNQLFPQNISQQVQIQTESRIEIIRNTNQNKKHLSTQIDASDEDISDEDDFHTVTASSYKFKIKSVDLEKLKAIRIKKNNKKCSRVFEQMGLSIQVNEKTSSERKIYLTKQTKSTSTSTGKSAKALGISSDSLLAEQKESNVDVEYLYIILPYLEKFNPYCGLCVRNCTFGKRYNNNDQLLRCALRCAGRPSCPFTCSVIINSGGDGVVIVSNTTIRHLRGVKICRPMRKAIRSLLKEKFSQGASVYRVYQEGMQKRTVEERKAFNYNRVGKSRDILRKIKSEGTVENLLAIEADEGIFKLHQQLQDEVNVDGKIKGAIQKISKYPCQVIVYSESSIRLFDSLLKYKNVILSWDATGSIIQEKQNSPRLLYYELSITLPGVVKEDSIVPVTFMISDRHTLIDIIHWIELFKYSYSQVFVGKTFPRPKVVLSDRAQVFLMASLQIWNNECMNDFLNRAYRIVTDDATDSDYEKTNIHACLVHVLKDARITINKFIPGQLRELAMWSIALLVNTSMWSDFRHSWKLICLVFLELHLGEDHVNQEHQDALLHKLTKIKSDTNTIDAIKLSDCVEDDNSEESSSTDVYNFDDVEDDDDRKSVAHVSKLTKEKILIDEEQQANATDSPS
ncbi:unnamed protein product [Adineta steineri]|uniref:Ubiquitin carboxyl-terminal hydrolase 36 n=1 Tax=Adineta steineri TaxID=433720 RepID=A0A819W0Q6_9BILA|nr:unnamed protein product [Adineta steineri]CAF4116736.1 unnamed protein product [Adineta steineri]